MLYDELLEFKAKIAKFKINFAFTGEVIEQADIVFEFPIPWNKYDKVSLVF